MSRPDELISIINSEFSDNRLTYQKAVATFHPESAEEAAKLISLAGKHKQKLYITGFGNNIDPVDEPFTSMVTIRTDRLNDILAVSAPDLYVKLGAGFPIREANKHIESEGIFLAHSALPYVGSVGGSIAVNLSAELNGHHLPIKKYLVRAEIVTGGGEIITPGSACFKSVSGFDIVKIYAQSWGLLGLIVSATFRVVPLAAADEFATMKMNGIDRENFLEGLRETNAGPDAIYSRKIKDKFDPHGILPIV